MDCSNSPLFFIFMSTKSMLMRYRIIRGSDEERLIMERNTIYQREDLILKVVVWLSVIAIVYMDIKTTFF